MADTKISALTAATGLTDDDLLVVVDGATTTKKITVANAAATTSAPGLLSAADKTKLDGIASGATAYTAENARDDVGAALVAGTNMTITVNDGANTITFDAAGGGGGASATHPSLAGFFAAHPTVVGGLHGPSLFDTGTASGTTGSGGAASGICYAIPFICDNTFTADRVSVGWHSAGTATSVLRLGVYADDGTYYPGARIADWGTMAHDTGTEGSITISQQFTAGTLYWIAIAVQTANGGNIKAVTALNQLFPFVKTLTGGAGYNRSNGLGSVADTGVTGALPANFTAVASTTLGYRAPVFILRVGSLP